MKKTSTMLSALLATTMTIQANALDILLTNDDGYQAEGINILYDTLTEAGHNVVMVAPKTDQSGKGSSTNTNLFVPVELVNYDSNKWYIDGTPVDAVGAGLDSVLRGEKPDLIISGANFGQNAGHIITMSGTVNAAIKGLHRNIPSIAVSVERNFRDASATLNAMDDAARFVVQVIDNLESSQPWYCKYKPEAADCANSTGALPLPDGVGLNINYPALEASEVTGVSYTRISDWSGVEFSIVPLGPYGPYAAGLVDQEGEPSAQQKREDVLMLEEGYITVTPLDPDLNASFYEFWSIKKLLGNMTP